MKRIIILLIAAIAAASCNTNTMKEKEIHLKIIETTDVHGAVFPENLIEQNTREGSLAQVYAYVKQQRESCDCEVVLLDNGDILQGSPVVYYYNFEAPDSVHLLARVMNFMNYDAATIGNHDIEAGHKVYDKFVRELDFDLLAANAVRDDNGKPYFKPYKIVERQGVKIAVLGLITPAIPNWLPHNIWSGMHFEDMVESARYWQKYIEENESPDLMIGLLHSGTDATFGGANPDDPKNENAAVLVAGKVPGFDVIFAGHDHRFANYFVANPDGDSTLIIDPAAHAANVGIADITLKFNDKTKKYRKEIKGDIVSMKDIKPDSLFKYKFNLGLEVVKKWVNRPVGVLKNKINAGDALYGPSPFVDLIHKAQLELTDADVSFVAPFSVTAVINKGQLYVRDMFKIYRYENFLYTMKMTGKEIRDYLEFSYSLWFNNSTDKNAPLLAVKTDENGKPEVYDNGMPALINPYYNFDSGAGIKYIVDLRKPVGQRVTIISMADGSSFDPGKTYTVAMNSYRGNGGGKHLTQGAGIPKDSLSSRLISSSESDFRLLFMKWIEKQGSIKAESMELWEVIRGKEKG
jgi:2',3'-cyclic-nucleotide 2'-phosphodiesterase/3'-nucleotidase